MDFQKIQKALSSYEPRDVSIFVAYLKMLETDKDKDGKLTNWWFPKISEDEFVNTFVSVEKEGVHLDGDTVTLGYRKKLLISYNYQAYKNRVISHYPESTFDTGLVYDNDDFSFYKESGKVVYNHKIGNPFALDKKVIGAYCIIKNKRGEFLETINMKDIGQMKNAATTKNIWDLWESEMIKKSVIKRACKTHFKDITESIDKVDNENYDLENVTVDSLLQKEVEEATTFNQLSKLFNDNMNKVKEKVAFTNILAGRKQELIDQLPYLEESDYQKALDMLKQKGKIEPLTFVWRMTPEMKERLIADVI